MSYIDQGLNCFDCYPHGCPCGYFGDPSHDCHCHPAKIQTYRARVSGPLLDRIDIHIEVPPVRYKDLSDEAGGEPSETIRERVNSARKVQTARFSTHRLAKPVHSNSQMTPRLVKKYVQLDEKSVNLLETAIDKLGLSARAYDRILKVARTIADLEGANDVVSNHISEAIQYRSFDRGIY